MRNYTVISLRSRMLTQLGGGKDVGSRTRACGWRGFLMNSSNPHAFDNLTLEG